MQATYLSSNVLANISWKATKATEADPEQHIVCVLFSCAFVEAAVNELLHYLDQIKTEDELAIRHLAREAGLYERLTPLERKLRVLAIASTGEPADFGATPLQEFCLLNDLRNWLVHLKPETLSLVENPHDEGDILINAEYHKLIQRLVSAKVIDSVPERRLLPVTTALCLPGVGQWSYRTAYSTVELLHAWVPGWKLGRVVPRP